MLGVNGMRDDGRSESLDGLRGIAVILTFCVHFFGTAIFLKYRASPDLLSIGQMKNAGDSLLFALFRSHYGVYLFFIISGFLIGRIVIADTPPFYRRFLWRRIQRIYPPFLLSFALAVIARVTYGGGYDPVSMPTLSGVIANLLFLNGLSALNVQVLIPNNVTWSLFFEMTFYIIAPFSWLVAPGRAGLIVLSCFGLWLAIILPDQASAPLFVPLFAGALLACVPAPRLRDYMKRIPSVVVAAIFDGCRMVMGKHWAIPIHVGFSWARDAVGRFCGLRRWLVVEDSGYAASRMVGARVIFLLSSSLACPVWVARAFSY